VVAVLVAGASGYLLLGRSHTSSNNNAVPSASHGLSLPDHVGQFNVLNTPVTRAAVAELVRGLRSTGSKTPVAKAYSADDRTTGVSAFITDAPVSARSSHLANVVAGFTDSFTKGTHASKPVVMRPGANGGYLVCGLRPGTTRSEAAAYCVWTDGSTLSEVSVYRGTVKAAYAVALKIRMSNGH
jgi:hypothetical protein